MKINIFILIILFSTSINSRANLISQIPGDYNAVHFVDQGYLDKSAEDIINSILNVVGLKPNFEIRAADISNAAAVNYEGKRFILYDPLFMNKIQNASQTDWAGISILAHEIGHHLNGHTLLKNGGDPVLELEADEFSGFVLRKMGASLEEAQKAMKLISNERDSPTHPKRSLRLAAIAKGYNSANEQLLASLNNINSIQPGIQNEEELPEDELIVAKSNPIIDKNSIFSEVYFNKMPNRKFYITKNLNLIEVTSEGVEVLGDIVKSSNDQLEINIFDENHIIKLYISSNGLLYNKNSVVGYLKSPMV